MSQEKDLDFRSDMHKAEKSYQDYSLCLVYVLLSVYCVLSSSNARAAEISLHGFLQGNYSADTASSNPDDGDFKLAEERLQLKFDASKDPLHLFLKTDAYYDHIDEEPELELREGYLDFTASKWDLRVGRQVITWGLGDLVFINDVFPKDYEAFFSGRPLEYMKKGIDGAKIGVYPGFASFEGKNLKRLGRLMPHTCDRHYHRSWN